MKLRETLSWEQRNCRTEEVRVRPVFFAFYSINFFSCHMGDRSFFFLNGGKGIGKKNLQQKFF